MTHEVIERLRADVKKLRSDRHNTAWRWMEDERAWRYKRDLANDIEAVLEVLTGSKGIM